MNTHNLSAAQSVTSAIVTISELGYIQSVDKRTCAMFGYTPDELQGKKVNVLIPPPYREQHDTYLENYKETGVKKIIGRNRAVEGLHKDGSIFPIMLSVTEVKVMGIRMFIGAMERVPDKSMILVSDVNGKIMSCNRACEEMLGYTTTELVGQSINTLMPQPHSHLHDNYIQENYHNGGMWRMLNHVRNLPIKHKSGVVFPVSILVDKVTTGGIVTFRATIEIPPKETVFTIDQEGNIVSCNFTYVRPMFGYSHNFLLGKNINMLVPELNLRDTGLENRKRKSASGALVSSWLSAIRTMQVRHQDGSEFPVNLEVAVLRPDERGNVLYSLKIKSVSFDPHHDVNAVTDDDKGGDESKHVHKEEMIGDYYVTKFLGRGNYGMVKLGVHKDTQAKVAIKILLKDNMDQVGYQRILREIKILQQLNHPNIARLYDVIEKPDALFLLMEYCGGGDLVTYLKQHHLNAQTELKIDSTSSFHSSTSSAAPTPPSTHTSSTDASSCSSNSSASNSFHSRLGKSEREDLSATLGKPIGEEEARKVFKQVTSAIHYCHSLNIIHRDIKHKNILFDNHQHVKLIDFGLSNWACGGNMSFCGTPAYASPEMLLGTQYTGPEVDVWSLGILLYSLVVGKLPFVNVIDIIKQNYTIPQEVSLECSDLIRRCLIVDVTKRTTLNDIMAHPWMHNLPLSALELPSTAFPPPSLYRTSSPPHSTNYSNNNNNNNVNNNNNNVNNNNNNVNNNNNNVNNNNSNNNNNSYNYSLLSATPNMQKMRASSSGFTSSSSLSSTSHSPLISLSDVSDGSESYIQPVISPSLIESVHLSSPPINSNSNYYTTTTTTNNDRGSSSQLNNNDNNGSSSNVNNFSNNISNNNVNNSSPNSRPDNSMEYTRETPPSTATTTTTQEATTTTPGGNL